ncbi:class I SAM-dependent methyltransferase [Mycolicibacterium sp. 050158]|uniref:class I SAM-dependent methyltransferase n=1 Tax=Mycolicibacterium sp. 050158 TaxID=3090602 RepID=UPI00299E3044|nr:class I SAM-dependent methyltransferase [Mycolicibacterium sp. 050158]MDX1888304.1 class I SAM-dependent methyltransferase [Mycolicibacterium sp. 050158]
MTRAHSGRTDGDTWDLASSVGVTATIVAAGRAIAGRATKPLMSDPYAEPLVRAVGVDLLTRLASGELSSDDLDAMGPMAAGLARLADNMAVRTVFFDDFFLDAARAGITQAVILASGLDSRAYRLPWPAGSTVYEIDQPEVIEFKSRTLAELGATPTAYRRAVAVDLREDWPAALRQAGFDPGRPTAWSAEGLLPYLPPEAQDRLLDAITELSAPGSRFASESMPKRSPHDDDQLRERMRDAAGQWREHGLDLDPTQLLYFGERHEVSAYLAQHGWHPEAHPLNELFAAHQLPPLADDDAGGFADTTYVSATLGEHR